MSHDTDEWCKVWRKIDSWFQKWREEFGEFCCEQWQVWKFALWCTTFAESILCFSQKSTEELCVIILKNDAKFEEELTCALKNDMRNLANFDSTLESLKICTLMESFWAKYIMFELKNYRGVIVMTLKGDAIFKEKLTGGLKNDIRNLIFMRAVTSLKICTLMGSFVQSM